MTPKDMSMILLDGTPNEPASTAQCFPERLMERDATIWPSMKDIAMDMRGEGLAQCVATTIATALPKRGECAGDMEKILRNAVTNGDAYTMRQKEGYVGCIPGQNAVKKGANAS